MGKDYLISSKALQLVKDTKVSSQVQKYKVDHRLFVIESCGICKECSEQQGKLSCCEHEFCFQCISEWAKRSRTCPLCRQTFYEINLIEKQY